MTFIGDTAFDHCSDLTSVTMRGVCPISSANALGKCKELKVIHVPANSKSWAGLEEWQGVPLAFDGEPLNPLKEKELMDAVQKQLAEESARQEKAKAKREAELAETKKRIQEIREELKRVKAK